MCLACEKLILWFHFFEILDASRMLVSVFVIRTFKLWTHWVMTCFQVPHNYCIAIYFSEYYIYVYDLCLLKTWVLHSLDLFWLLEAWQPDWGLEVWKNACDTNKLDWWMIGPWSVSNVSHDMPRMELNESDQYECYEYKPCTINLIYNADYISLTTYIFMYTYILYPHIVIMYYIYTTDHWYQPVLHRT